MQKMTVVMPTYRRPEMLALSLESLRATSEANNPNLYVRIHLDHSNIDRLNEVEYVRDTYFPEASIFHAANHCLAPSGCWNILHALKSGWETQAEYIFLVEEDVLVRPDFFAKHLEMQQSGDYFVTSGRNLSYLPENYFTNPGSCYHRDKLALVIPHICNAYFADLNGYLDHHFGPFPDGGDLDDGMIRRVMRSVGGKAKCAEPKICNHIGWHYYQKMQNYKNEGTIQERIEWIRNFLSDIPARKQADPRYIGDLEEF